MKLRTFSVFALSALCQLALAGGSNCTMLPAPIDISRIAHRSEVKSYTVDANKLGVTALLKNGRAMRLAHMGCVHSGAEAALWFQSAVPASDVKKWLKEAVALANIAFSPDISKDIERSLKSGKYESEVTDTRLSITASPTEFFTYTIVLEPEGHRVILSVGYSIGG